VSEAGSIGKGERTDPRSFAVKGIAMLGQLALPLGFAAYSIFNSGETGRFFGYLAPFALLLVGLSFAFAYLAWWRLTYWVGETDIRIESGIISRAARSVPYERIQDVSIEQKLLPRLFGLASIKFETGAGGKDELALAYLTEAEGERLRELVRTRKSEAEAGLEAAKGLESAVAIEDASLAGPPLFAMSSGRVITFGIFEFSLTVMAVLAGAAQQLELFLPSEISDPRRWLSYLEGPGEYLAGLGPLVQILGIVSALVAVAIVGTMAGLVRTILRDWGFTLKRTDKGFRRQRGLFTRTDVVMPAHRVQALKFSTKIIRRRFGWHGLKFVSLAQDAGGSSHSVAPFARWQELEPIALEAGFTPPHEGLDWQRASENYRMDTALLTLFFLIPLAIVTATLIYFSREFLGGGYEALIVGLAIVFAIGMIARPLFMWRFERHALDENQLYSRRGWLAPHTDVASRLKLQSVEIAQGPIASRRGYASLYLGLAGGRMQVPGLPIERARELRVAILASIASRDFSQLV
jgi:putative membrane protein